MKKVISKCFTCKKFNNLAFKYPKITNLPKHRVNFIKPFKQTGIDFTGHVWVKQRENTKKKMYILIFTCLNVWVIHIEIVEDISTAAFVHALIRFSNIYGAPSYIYSDNARSFNAALGGGDIVEHHVHSTDFENKFRSYQIKHIKIPLHSPWVGST